MMTDTERADAISRRRARAMPFLALLILVMQQGLFVTWDGRAVTIVQMAGWTVMVLVLLAVLLTGGSWFAPRRVRALANDEITRANRAKALERGFLAAVLVAILVFLVSPFEPISSQRAAHLIISIGLAVALIAFGFEERKALD